MSRSRRRTLSPCCLCHVYRCWSLCNSFVLFCEHNKTSQEDPRGLEGGSQKDGAVSRNLLSGKGVRELTQVLVKPQVTKLEGGVVGEVLEVGGDVERLVSHVEEGDGVLSVLQLTNPDLVVLLEGRESVALETEGILVDGNDLLVQKDLLGPVVDGSQIVAHQEGSSEDGPEGHLGLGLLVVETVLHADDEHIGVVPVAGAGVLPPLGHVAPVLDDVADGVPAVADIVPVSPEVAVLDEEAVVHLRGVGGPGAGVHDGAAGGVQEVGHALVAVGVVEAGAVAAVHLQVVDVPLGEGLRVGQEVALRAGVARA